LPKATWQAALSSWASAALVGSTPFSRPALQSAVSCYVKDSALTEKSIVELPLGWTLP